jgi:formamidopyrimidine-DNA glycosylase
LPELPEVETLCRQLKAILPGEEILGVEIRDPRLGKVEGLVGNRITAVSRRGKSIRIDLKRGPAVSLHLRMTGRLLWQDDACPIPPYTRMVISLAVGKLFLIDPRRFATFRAGSQEILSAPLADPLDEGLPARRLREIAGSRRLPVKSFLMDQRFIAGIGNIYACEILHGAGVDPRRPTGSLTAAEWRRVEKAAAVILPRAVACRGTTVSDWRDLFGMSGTNQEHLEVYARQGEPCRRCGAGIERLAMGGRGTWFCPSCQR